MLFGCRSRPPYASLLLATSLVWLLACEEKRPHELTFDVGFACDEDRELADELSLRVLRGGCDGEETVYEATLAKGDEAPPANGVAPGAYGLTASAYRKGALVAKICLETTLPQTSGADTPVLILRSESCDAPLPLDAGGELDAEEAGELDAGAQTEAGTSDAAPRTCPSDCSDPFPCTDDRCVNGECVHEPFTGVRECDGVMCTQGDRCEAGTCQAGTPNDKACPDDGNPCTAETCELGTGCNRDSAEGAACNDSISCTNMDVCKNGICRGTDSCTSGGVCSAASGMCIACTAATDCNDRDPCTTDSCATGVCRNVPNTSACNDNKTCTTNDVCNNRVCAGTSTCPSDATCGGSTCRCNDASKALCSNTCVTLSSNAQHCGQCGRVCNDGSCQNSACKPNNANNCTAYRFGGHDYLICSDNLSWTSARDRCRGWGYGLAIIDSQEENDFLKGKSPTGDHWIGANDRGDNGRDCRLDNEEGSWYWADPTTNSGGENFRPLCRMNSQDGWHCAAINGAYQNWGSNEPNNAECDCFLIGGCNAAEDCGVQRADGAWNDSPCDSGLGFVCETP